MPRKIKDVTKDYLVNVTLPVHGQTYTVISHQSIIDYAYAELANQGFSIVDEEYRATLDGQIAQGIYKLQHGTDPEMNVMFAWTNSYNKQIRFKCATGGYVNNNQTIMLAGELGSYARKHTGTADADVIASMQAQITDATMYYNQLVDDKELMKTITLTSRKQAELLGILFAEYEVLTTEQASIIRQQMDKPSYFYNGGKDTLWSFYNHCTVALQHSHPRSWMEDQRMLHWVITNEFNLNAPALIIQDTVEDTEEIVDPLLTNYGQPENQTNLLVQIAEIEEEQMIVGDEPPRLPVEPADYDFSQTVDLATAVAMVNIMEKPLMSAEMVVIDFSKPEKGVIPIQDYIEKNATEDVEATEDTFEYEVETVNYTDPVGNTFEAPVVTPCAAHDVETEKDEDIEFNSVEEEMLALEDSSFFAETELIEPVVEEEIQVAPERVKFAIDDDFDLSLDLDDNSNDNDLFL